MKLHLSEEQTLAVLRACEDEAESAWCNYKDVSEQDEKAAFLKQAETLEEVIEMIRNR